ANRLSDWRFRTTADAARQWLPNCSALQADMSTSGRVLIVDDYEANIAAMRQLLERQGYDVLTASNGRDALDLVHREHPDLVLLDVVMPDVSGLDVCAPLKNVAETSLTPVVLVSALQERA